MKKVNEIIKEYLNTLEARTYRDFLAESLCASQTLTAEEIKKMVNTVADYFFNTDNYEKALETADKMRTNGAYDKLNLNELINRLGQEKLMEASQALYPIKVGIEILQDPRLVKEKIQAACKKMCQIICQEFMMYIPPLKGEEYRNISKLHRMIEVNRA